MSDEPKHPAPWKWGSYYDDLGVFALIDANGGNIWIEEHEDGGVDAGTKALIAAAPELEAMLRKHEWSALVTTTHEEQAGCPDCQAPRDFMASKPSHGHKPDCALAALLSRIDSAKVAG